MNRFWLASIVLIAASTLCISASSAKIEVLVNGPIFVPKNGAGKATIPLAIPADSGDKTLLLCHKKHWYWRSKCRPIKLNDGESTVDLPGNKLEEGKYYFALKANSFLSNRAHKSKTFKVLALDNLVQSSPVVVNAFKFVERPATQQLIANMEIWHSSYSDEKIVVKVYDAETGKRLSSVKQTLSPKSALSLDLKVHHQRGRVYYAEVYAYTSSLREIFRRKKLVYRTLSRSSGRNRDASDSSLRMVTIKVNPMTAKATGPFHVDPESAPAIRNDVGSPLELQWKALFDHSAFLLRRGTDRKSILQDSKTASGHWVPVGIMTLMPAVMLNDDIMQTAMAIWHRSLMMPFRDTVGIILPNVISPPINGQEEFYNNIRQNYPLDARYHLMIFNVYPAHWISIVYDAQVTKYLIFDSSRRSSSFEYGSYISIFSHVLASMLRVENVLRPESSVNVEFKFHANTARVLTSDDVPNSDPIFDSVKVYMLGQERSVGANDCGPFALMNAFYFISSDLVADVIADRYVEAPLISPESFYDFRRNLFVEIGSLCEASTPAGQQIMQFPECVNVQTGMQFLGN